MTSTILGAFGAWIVTLKALAMLNSSIDEYIVPLES